MTVFLVFVAALLVMLIFLIVLDCIVHPKFLCDFLDWHTPDYSSIMKDPYGFQHSYRCKRCGRKITQDSQGNWFSLEN